MTIIPVITSKKTVMEALGVDLETLKKVESEAGVRVSEEQDGYSIRDLKRLVTASEAFFVPQQARHNSA